MLFVKPLGLFLFRSQLLSLIRLQFSSVSVYSFTLAVTVRKVFLWTTLVHEF